MVFCVSIVIVSPHRFMLQCHCEKCVVQKVQGIENEKKKKGNEGRERSKNNHPENKEEEEGRLQI